MLSDLAWLPPAPSDFRARLKALRAEAAETGDGFAAELLALASTALDETQLSQIGRLAAKAAQNPAKLFGFTKVKLGLLGDGTLSLLGAAIAGSGVRHGLLIDVIEGGYGSAVQEALDPGSALRTAGLDMALLVNDARLLGLDRAALTPEGAEQQVEAAFARVRRIVDGLRESVASAVLVQTVAPPFEPLFGSFDRLVAGSPFALVEALNLRLAAWSGEGAMHLVDIARLAQSIGLERWDDPRHWHASKLPFAPAMIPAYADTVARTIAAIRGRARKCLVLDLDNTLWGGVIGDDGLEGIVLGQGSATGEAHLAIQRLALELRARGIVLAVCSKNEEDAARLPFGQHPEMLLGADDIAVFQANWTDKATNLRAIAQSLNIGLDALVFLDDNPAERAQVRRELPMVAVPEVPDDPAYFPRMLMAAGYFESVSFSDEDRQRAEFYQANSRRASLEAGASDLETYLRSLDMVCTIAPIDAISRPRAAQLINKSNQFNLTTRRYSEQEVAALEADPQVHAIQVRLTDCFGDNGLISVVVARANEEAWDIDTWLMSCRVLGRRVEQAVLNHLAAAASAAGARTLVGRYIPSEKNRMVADHYAKLGFTQAEALSDGTTIWRLGLASFEPAELPLEVRDATEAAPPQQMESSAA